MKYEQSAKDLYKIAGMLEMLCCMEGQNITHCMTLEIEDAVDKLELIGAEMINALQEPKILIKDIPVDLLDERPMKKVVKVHEGSEESPPEPQPADQ